MKIIDVPQGSSAWFAARLGIPTASEFGKIVTPKTGKLSATSRTYAYRLVAERLLNAPTQTLDGLTYIERGREMEPQAAAQYAFENDVELLTVGFVTTDDGRAGASPVRLVKGHPYGVEIKCPAGHTHVGYLLEGAAETYRPQVMGQLLIAELERVDLYSFHPRMPPATIRTYRDEAYIGLVKSALDEFTDRLDRLCERARTLGIFQAFEEVAAPLEAELGDELRRAADKEFEDDWL